MINNFTIEPKWLSSSIGNELEKATFSSIKLTLSGKVISRLDDKLADTVRDEFRSSSYYLAYWFAENWWRILYEPERTSIDWALSHSLSSIGHGFIWPNISFSSDGETILINVKPTCEAQQPINFITNYKASIPVDIFAKSISYFIEKVIRRLYEKGLKETQLNSLWNEIKKENNNPLCKTWRIREALLGLDPDDCSEKIYNKLESENKLVGAFAVNEILAADPEKPIETISKIKENVGKFARAIKIPDYNETRAELENAFDNVFLPWEKGEKAASIFRRKLNLGSGPISDNELNGIFSFSLSKEETGDLMPGIIDATGFREDMNEDKIKVFIPYKNFSSSQRFSLIRIIGDHFISSDPNDKYLPVTESKTLRQKFQRAFAQEFLCPFDSLKDYFGNNQNPGNNLIDEAASYFHVSPLTVLSTLRNKGFISPDYYSI